MPLGEQFPAVLAAARTGADWAWARLYDDLAPLVLGYLRSQRAPEPEDLTSEVFLQLVRDLAQFDGDESDFRSWLLTITHHRLVDARRYRGRRPSDATPADQLEREMEPSGIEPDALDSLAAGELQPHLDRLTDDQRAVLLLRFVADLKIREVAEAVDKSENAVKQLQLRGLAAVRRSLDDGA